VEFEQPDLTWEEIKRAFRRACICHHQGQAEEAADLMQSRLPAMLERWSRTAPDPPAEKRIRVEAMFAEEMKRVEDALFFQEVIVERLGAQFSEELDRTYHALRGSLSTGNKLRERELDRMLDPVARKMESLLATLKGDLTQAHHGEPPVELQGMFEQLREEIRGKERPEIDVKGLLEPIRNELSEVIGPLRAEMQTQRNTQKPEFEGLAEMVRTELRAMGEEISADMKAREKASNAELRTLMKAIKIDLQAFEETPGREIRSQLDALRAELTELIGNPKREIRQAVEPLRQALGELKEEHDEELRTRLEHIERNLSGLAGLDPTEAVRRALGPLREEIEDLREMPNAEIQSIRNSLITVLKTLREFPHAEIRDELANTRKDLDELCKAPLREFEVLGELLKSNLEVLQERPHKRIEEELHALRADMETLWANPSESISDLIEPLKQDMRDLLRYPADERLDGVIAPIANDLSALRKRIADLCKAVHFAAETIGREEDAKRAAPNTKQEAITGAVSRARRARRELLAHIQLDEAKPVERIPFADVQSAIDHILEEDRRHKV